MIIPAPLRKKLNIALYTTTLLLYIACVGYFNLNVLESVLLLAATPVIIWLALKLTLPPLQKVGKRYQQSISKTNHLEKAAIKEAKKQGKKPFHLGNEKQHLVYAKNFIEARKFYNENILYLALKYPKKRYYHITANYTNI